MNPYDVFVLAAGEEASVRPGGGEPGEEAEADHRAPGAGPHQPAAGRGQAHQGRAGQGAVQVPEHAQEPQEGGEAPHALC